MISGNPGIPYDVRLEKFHLSILVGEIHGPPVF